jgi:GTP cyclohydrolase I
MDANLIPHCGPSLMVPVEDVQGRIDTRQQPIDRVGIKDILHPVRIRDRAQGSSVLLLNSR